MPAISQLFIYPIKSLGGIALTEAQITSRGFMHDRRWMLVNEENEFLSQRSVPAMALLQVNLHADGLLIQFNKIGQSIVVPFEPSGQLCRVSIWSDACKAIEVNSLVSEWFSDILSVKCKLVYMPDTIRRRVDARYAPNDSVTGFADAFPFLMIGQSSLDDLNARLQEPVPVNRFRPNIVVTGAPPYTEDEWARFSIKHSEFYGVKRCARCQIININQQTATAAKDPLRTLAAYRSFGKKVYFGHYLVHEGEGIIKTGDTLEIKERKTYAGSV